MNSPATPLHDYGDTRHVRRVRLIYAICFMSGAAGLGYQIAWARMFAIGLGHEMPSVLAVVAAFFGGLALGAWALDGKVSRSPHPGRWYAGLETMIGVWGLVSIALIGRFNTLALDLTGVEPTPLRQWAVAFALPFICLLPATTAMGATLPAVERLVAPLVRGGRCVGGLYAANTAGAVIGTLASAFVIMPRFGFTATVVLLAVVNLLCAAAAAAIAQQPTPKLTHSNPQPQPTVSAANALPMRRVVATVFLTGLLGIGYEALGVRVISQVLENTVYTFAAVLSIYLIGTAIGAALYQRFGRTAAPSTLLSYLLLSIATACMLGILAMPHTKTVYANARRELFGDSLLGVGAAEMAVALMVFAIPTMLMGATFSHLVQAAKHDRGGVGRAMAINTLGAALAPLVFGVILLPWIGAKWSLVAASLGYLLLIPNNSNIRWALQAIPVLLVLALPANLQLLTLYPESKVLDYREGVMASVAVVQESDGHKSLRVNNRFQMGTTRGAVDECLQAYVPLLLHEQPQRALFLGLGSSITFRAASFMPGLTADGVELIPEVVAVSHHFEPANLPPGYEQSLNTYVADARRFVRVTDHRYDVIVADLFHPGRDGAGWLYTIEHFEAVKQRLNPGGVFCQWLPLYQLDEPTAAVIIRTLMQVFPNARACVVDFKLDHPMLGLIATTEPVSYGPDWYRNRVKDKTLAGMLRGALLQNGVRLFGSFIADTESLQRFAADAPINTDDHPVVLFSAPRFTSQLDITMYGRLIAMLEKCDVDLDNLIDPAAGPDADRFKARLAQFIVARDAYLNGLVAAAEGEEQLAIDLFIESIEASVQFTTSYAHCLAIAQHYMKSDPTAARALIQRVIDARPERTDAKTLLQSLTRNTATDETAG